MKSQAAVDERKEEIGVAFCEFLESVARGLAHDGFSVPQANEITLLSHLGPTLAYAISLELGRDEVDAVIRTFLDLMYENRG